MSDELAKSAPSPADVAWYADRARVREIAVRLCQRGCLNADADPRAEARIAIEALTVIANGKDGQQE